MVKYDQEKKKQLPTLILNVFNIILGDITTLWVFDAPCLKKEKALCIINENSVIKKRQSSTTQKNKNR